MFKRLTIAFVALTCLLAGTASAVIQQPMQRGAYQSSFMPVPAVSSSDSFFYFNELTCRNNPMEGIDPYGLWVEDLVLGVPSLALGGVSLWQNIKEGNIGGSLVDVVGIVADAAAIALPVVPGGVGYSIKAARAVRALNRADTVLNVGLATANAYEASQESDQLGVAVNSGQAVLQMGSSALGLRKARRLTEALSDNAGDATKVVGKLDGVSVSRQGYKSVTLGEATPGSPVYSKYSNPILKNIPGLRKVSYPNRDWRFTRAGQQAPFWRKMETSLHEAKHVQDFARHPQVTHLAGSYLPGRGVSRFALEYRGYSAGALSPFVNPQRAIRSMDPISRLYLAGETGALGYGLYHAVNGAEE